MIKESKPITNLAPTMTPWRIETSSMMELVDASDDGLTIAFVKSELPKFTELKDKLNTLYSMPSIDEILEQRDQAISVCRLARKLIKGQPSDLQIKILLEHLDTVLSIITPETSDH